MAELAGRPLLLPHEIEDLRSIGVERHFAPGERLVSIGSESSEVYFLVDGLVKIVVMSTAGTESCSACAAAATSSAR